MGLFNKNSVAVVLMVLCSLSSCQEKLDRPNIILIMTDDQGWFDAGFNGNSEIITPNLDKLAKKGVIFNRFYAASAVCSPTRASVITGRNPLRMNIPNANTGHMKEGEITLPELLKAEGYTTAHFGKWHLGTLTKKELDANRGGQDKYLEDYSIPTMHGYDSYFCTESKVPTFDPMIFPSSFETGESKRYGWKVVEPDEEKESYGTSYWHGVEEKTQTDLSGDDTKIIMDRVLPFIDEAVHKNLPYFTTIWTHTPHLPVVSDSVHTANYSTMDVQKQLYYGTITAMDEQIGRLWDKLGDLEVQDNTIIWFCSDNGPERMTPGSAGVFRERKRSLYEGGVRVPAFMLWPQKVSGGRKLDIPAVTSDYLPTLLDILNLPLPDRPIDGTSLWSALIGGQKDRKKSIGFIYGQKLSWVDDRYKLISVDHGEHFELYDLLNDKGEKKNIIQEKPEIASKMKKEFNQWMLSVNHSKKGGDY